MLISVVKMKKLKSVKEKSFFFETVVQDIFKPNLQSQVVYSRQLCVSLL